MDEICRLIGDVSVRLKLLMLMMIGKKQPQLVVARAILYRDSKNTAMQCEIPHLPVHGDPEHRRNEIVWTTLIMARCKMGRSGVSSWNRPRAGVGVVATVSSRPSNARSGDGNRATATQKHQIQVQCANGLRLEKDGMESRWNHFG
jgi:hypothetical protein